MDENGRLKKIQKVSFWELGFLKIQVQNCCRLVSGRLTIAGKSAELGKSSHPFSTSELELDLNTFRKKKTSGLDGICDSTYTYRKTLYAGRVLGGLRHLCKMVSWTP